MANFKGFKQVLLSTYNATSVEEKKDYLWLVRELDASGETLSSAIYFGNRKYADITKQAEDPRVGSLIASLGSFVDENGEWVGFLPVEEHAILGNSGVTSVADALTALEAAILENASAIQGKADESDLEALETVVEGVEGNVEALSAATESVAADLADVADEVAELAEKINSGATKADVEAVDAKVEALSAATVAFSAATEAAIEALEDKDEVLEAAISGISEELETKANAADVYTKSETYNKEEIDAKVVGAFKFKGEASAVSADETTILLLNGEEVVASDENVGFVYQIEDAEFASNGEKWVKLGFNIDLTDYAKKEYVDEAVAEEAAAREALADDVALTQSALTHEIDEREALAERVTEAEAEIVDLDERATITANTYSEAAALQNLRLGKIVYVLNSEEESGITYTSGAYINTDAGLKKLDSTTPSTSTTLEERVEELENKVGAIENEIGDTEFEGDSITAAIAELQVSHDITGDDVEE